MGLEIVTAIATAQGADAAPPRMRTATFPLARWFRPGWPLVWLYVLFPLWWLMGLSQFIFMLAAIPMTWELLRRRPVLTPHGFGWWLLFLVVVAAGGTLLWVVPPGTVPAQGLGELVPYVFGVGWYVTITVFLLYVINMSERELPSRRIMQLLGLMFVYTTVGGLAGVLLPNVQLTSLVEMVLQVPKDTFFYALVHPSLATPSDFLGYSQARPQAPFMYANSWGNNLALFAPFFFITWLRTDAGWRRPAGLAIIALSFIPIAYSLNRGLWGALVAAVVLVAVRLAIMGRTRMLLGTLALAFLGVVAFVSSPLYDTVALRVDTPHSNERRATVADEVFSRTVAVSPVLGYGESREVTGSFNSIAGGETPQCRQCAAPPLGTQGFLWRLIFTTGLLGTALFLAFCVVQLARFGAGRDVVAITGCLIIVLALILSFVYDSLESPMVTMMVAIGLMSRRFAAQDQLARSKP